MSLQCSDKINAYLAFPTPTKLKEKSLNIFPEFNNEH